MRRDTGLGNCPACNSTWIEMIPRSMSLLPGKDLVCGECGERWPFEPAGDPWATPPRQPVQASDDPIDEDALDAVWERWGDSQD